MNIAEQMLEQIRAHNSRPKPPRKQPYKKPDSLKKLEQAHYDNKVAKHPDFYNVRTKFRDDSANSLTKVVISFLKLAGHQAERINTMGRPQYQSHITTDWTGQQHRTGSVKWIPSGSTPGSADISATINGRSVKIEVKYGKDRQSEAQRKYQKSIEDAGGVYIIIRNFDEFKKWYDIFAG